MLKQKQKKKLLLNNFKIKIIIKKNQIEEIMKFSLDFSNIAKLGILTIEKSKSKGFENNNQVYQTSEFISIFEKYPYEKINKLISQGSKLEKKDFLDEIFSQIENLQKIEFHENVILIIQLFKKIVEEETNSVFYTKILKISLVLFKALRENLGKEQAKGIFSIVIELFHEKTVKILKEIYQTLDNFLFCLDFIDVTYKK